jgi:hypothetical protein
MKKTLITLAALAATGTTFAQATISGNVGFSWQQSPVKAANGDGSHVQGFAINDGEIYISAKEDLGGGMSATARGGFTMRGRSNAIGDRDATVGVTGGFGTITLGSFRSCGSVMGILSGVVTGTVYSSNESNNFTPLDKCPLVDAAVYSMPVGPVRLSATYGEFGSSVSDTSSTDRGNTTGITFTDVGGVYNSGPLMASLNVTVFASTSTGTLKNDAPDGTVRTRLAGTYDAGIAKFGLGYQNKSNGFADQYAASVSVPMGNTVFGLDYTARAAQGVGEKGEKGATSAYALGGNRDGDKASSSVGVGVTYNFSKTLSLNASYITYTDAGANDKYGTPVAASAPVFNNDGTVKTAGKTANAFPAGTTSSQLDTEYRIRLMKSF